MEMEEPVDEYKLIVSLQTLLLTVGPLIAFFVIVMVCKPKKCFGNNVESSLRPKVPVTKTPSVFIEIGENCGETRSFKGIDITRTDNKASFGRTFYTFLYTFLLLFGGVTTVLFQFLLLEISYNLAMQTSNYRLLFHAADISHSCEQNEEASKDCFKYDAWKKIYTMGDPIDCNSTTVQNGSIDMICYRTVFFIELTSGKNYGFRLSLVILNVATGAVIIITILKLYSIVANRGPTNRGHLKPKTSREYMYS